MYRPTSGKTAFSVSSQRPKLEETRDSAADASVSLSPPILSPQVTSSEAMRMLASQENVSNTELLCVADTMLSLGSEVLAPHPAPQPLYHFQTPPFHLLAARRSRNGLSFAALLWT